MPVSIIPYLWAKRKQTCLGQGQTGNCNECDLPSHVCYCTHINQHSSVPMSTDTRSQGNTGSFPGLPLWASGSGPPPNVNSRLVWPLL